MEFLLSQGYKHTMSSDSTQQEAVQGHTWKCQALFYRVKEAFPEEMPTNLNEGSLSPEPVCRGQGGQAVEDWRLRAWDGDEGRCSVLRHSQVICRMVRSQSEGGRHVEG